MIMKKRSKSVLALILCLILALSAASSVFAEEDREIGTGFTKDSIGASEENSESAVSQAPKTGGNLLTFPGRRYYSKAFEVLNLVNSERAKNGLPALKMDADLLEGAMDRGAECVFLFSHYRPNDSWCVDIDDKAVAENIAMGQPSAADVMTSWMGSPGHRANILGNYTTIGIGCFYYEGIYYWVQLFGTNSITGNCSQPGDLTTSWEVDIPKSSVYDQYFGEQRDFALTIDPPRLGLTEGEVWAVDLYGYGNLDEPYFAQEVRFDRASVGWTSGDPSIASVDQRGNVKGLSPGTTVIYAGSDSVSARDSISVAVFRRIAGRNRYETAFAAAEHLKTSLGVSSFDNILIASGMDYADALAGAYLAKVKNAPIILVNSATVDIAASYARDNLKSGGRVYILGGPGAVPASMEQALEGIEVERLAGANRYMTNIEIIKAAGVSDEDILVCSGNGFPDALSASAVGSPILLTGNTLLPQQEELLDTLDTGKFWLIGGTAVVTPRVADALAARGTAVERLAGANRYATSTAVARQFFGSSVKNVMLAYADDFPDGLAGGPVAMTLGAPLILIKHGSTAEAERYISEVDAEAAYVMGGKSLIPGDDVGKTMTGN